MSKKQKHSEWKKLYSQTRCSVFIKLFVEKKTNKLQDVLLAHSTWEGYYELNRIYKFYTFNVFGNTK